MHKIFNSVLSFFITLTLSCSFLLQTTWADSKPPICDSLHVNGKASNSLSHVNLPPHGTCKVSSINGYPIPDLSCTPGAIDPTVTLAVLKTKGYKTKCVRNQAESEREKGVVYAWYSIKEPSDNRYANQTCELDHFVPLELGGADTLDNIWPQCGPDGVAIGSRYFKMKDKVEGYLARQVKAGKMSLQDAQKGIATDWTQYLNQAIHSRLTKEK